MKKIVYLFILLNSEKNEPRSAAAVIGPFGLSLRSPSGGCGTRSAQTVLALFLPSPLRLRRPIKAESGFVLLLEFQPPRPAGTPPIFLSGTQGERLRCIPLSPLLRFYTEYPAMLRDTVGGEGAYPSHYRYRYYLTLPSLRATSSIFCWAKHPVMLRDTAKEEF